MDEYSYIMIIMLMYDATHLAFIINFAALIPNYLHGQQQDAEEFLTGVMGNLCDLLTLAKR